MEAAPAHANPIPDVQMAGEDSNQHSNKKFKSTKRSFGDTVSAHATINVEEPTREDANEWAFEDPDVESNSEMEESEKNDGRPEERW